MFVIRPANGDLVEVFDTETRRILARGALVIDAISFLPGQEIRCGVEFIGMTVEGEEAHQ